MRSYPVAELAVATPSAVADVRQQIIETISGASVITPPTQQFYDGFANLGDPIGYYGQTPASAEWWGWIYTFGGPNSPAPNTNMTARTHFSTFSGSNNLLLYNAGHGQGFFPPAPGYSFVSPTATRDFIRRMVNEVGCDVILNCAPLDGENIYFRQYVGLQYSGDVHGALGTLSAHAPPAGTPLRYFVEPAIGSLSYALGQRSYDKVIVAGLSHGGWLTTLLAAIDPRITHSYAVAGSVPFANRIGAEGDWEQFDGIEALGVDYHDLYLMGTIDSSGDPTRKARLLHNGQDEVCFKGPAATAFASWLKPYADANGFGSLRVFVDPTETEHKIGANHANLIVADALAA